MRAVNRAAVTVPPSLVLGAEAERHRFRDWKAIQDPKRKAFKFTAYKMGDVREALEMLFHGKCAYCETFYGASAPVDVEHYRPKGGVADAPAHGGYWWLAMDWDNLLPSCIDCNRRRTQTSLDNASDQAKGRTAKRGSSGKQNSFPVANETHRAVAESFDLAGEDALLLDPCRDNPQAHLSYNFDAKWPFGVMLSTGDAHARLRGDASIEIYGLNRTRLVQDRTRVLRHLEFLAGKVLDIRGRLERIEKSSEGKVMTDSDLIDAASLRTDVTDMLAEIRVLAAEDAPYTAMVRSWISDFKQRLS